jgi:CRISPR-associated protein Cmr2
VTTWLHFSLGPVQGFVTQSRRTRDLWGSSYLLSFLAGHALNGALGAGAEVVHPRVEEDPLFQWIRGQRSGEPPRIGSLPNTFVVQLAEAARAREVAGSCRQALERAWRQVSHAVWERFVAPVKERGQGTEAIYRRQVEGFWEVTWVAGPAGDRSLRARRKRWRTHAPHEEPGDKCMVMPELQELSGYVRATERRRRQDEFWSALRGNLGELDMREDERLCAIALIKRLFARPEVARQALGWRPDTSHWPSTLYVAAVPWIRRVIHAAPEHARRYAEAVRGAAPEDARAERAPAFEGLVEPAAGDLPRLDGNYLQRAFVRSQKLAPLKEEAARQGLLERLDELAKQEDGEGPLGVAPVFYGLLLADGDRLGALVSRLDGARVSRVLADFTARVPGIVRSRDGVVLYAGGDDVLAMLPMRSALACARELSLAYRQAFEQGASGEAATLSAAVVLAHVRAPLSRTLAEAHRLLEEVAKEENGRDSLAVAVHKRGGPHCQWVTAWRRPGDVDSVEELEAIAAQLRGAGGDLSGARLHGLVETLGLLCQWPAREPGQWGALLEGLEPEAFLAAELLRTLEHAPGGAPADAQERARALARRLWALLPRARSEPPSVGAPLQVGLDALLLAHFLSTGGHEEEHT